MDVSSISNLPLAMQRMVQRKVGKGTGGVPASFRPGVLGCGGPRVGVVVSGFGVGPGASVVGFAFGALSGADVLGSRLGLVSSEGRIESGSSVVPGDGVVGSGFGVVQSGHQNDELAVGHAAHAEQGEGSEQQNAGRVSSTPRVGQGLGVGGIVCKFGVRF